jgi:hypothetical protein
VLVVVERRPARVRAVSRTRSCAPAVTQDRLERLAEDRLELSFARPWTMGIVLACVLGIRAQSDNASMVVVLPAGYVPETVSLSVLALEPLFVFIEPLRRAGTRALGQFRGSSSVVSS